MFNKSALLYESIGLNKLYLALWRRQKRVKVAPRSFPLLVLVVANKYFYGNQVSV